MDDLTPYGKERWAAGSQWRPGLKPDGDQAEGPVTQWLRKNPEKPFLTAADLVLLRKMKITLC